MHTTQTKKSSKQAEKRNQKENKKSSKSQAEKKQGGSKKTTGTASKSETKKTSKTNTKTTTVTSSGSSTTYSSSRVSKRNQRENKAHTADTSVKSRALPTAAEAAWKKEKKAAASGFTASIRGTGKATLSTIKKKSYTKGIAKQNSKKALKKWRRYRVATVRDFQRTIRSWSYR